MTSISPDSAYGGTRSMRSPLQKRPGSYQLAGRRLRELHARLAKVERQAQAGDVAPLSTAT